MNTSARGFTLVELLITMAIIGTLAGLVIVGYGGQLTRGRDAERRSDVRQYQTALEAYANANGNLYPAYPGSGTDVLSLCGSGGELEESKCQDDPVPTQSYIYVSDAQGLDYVLYARLERVNGYYVVCSNGQVGEKGMGSWTTPTNGECPSGLVPQLPPGS